MVLRQKRLKTIKFPSFMLFSVTVFESQCSDSYKAELGFCCCCRLSMSCTSSTSHSPLLMFSCFHSQSHSWTLYRRWHRTPFITDIPHGRGWWGEVQKGEPSCSRQKPQEEKIFKHPKNVVLLYKYEHRLFKWQHGNWNVKVIYFRCSAKV